MPYQLSIGLAGTVVTSVGMALVAGLLGPGVVREVQPDLQAASMDPEWRDYFPGAADEAASFAITSLTRDRWSQSRRVRLVELPSQVEIELCFDDGAEALARSCPEGTPLGRITRAVDARWVGLVGETSLDYAALLRLPAPGPGAPQLAFGAQQRLS